MSASMEEDRETTSDSEGCDVDDENVIEFTGHENISTFVNTLFSYLVEGTQVYNSLPTQDDFRYHETFRAFPKEMAQYASILLQLIEDTSKVAMKKPIDLSKQIDSEAKMDSIVEIVDNLLEAVDGTLDELKGKKDKANAAARRYVSMKRIGGVLRPQLKFNPPPDNSAAPFRIKIFKDGKLTFGEPGVHHYEEQIRAFKPSPSQLKCKQEQLYKGLDDVKCHWIDTVSRLQELERILSNSTEVAVDIEAHSYRSYQGFICLLQFSTREEDFLVDALELHDHLHCLHGFFTNPNITKVMHGAHYDVEWLQRDFGIYIVNLFDTSCAAKVLEYPALSLAYLLKYFCEITADKRFQTADWRMRPLPSEMLKYAREDTHYLLYIYDRLRVLLSQTAGNSFGLSGLEECYEMSKEICLRRYEKDLLTESSVQQYILKKAPGLTRQQEDVVRALLQWRDTVARAEDESRGYVLPSPMLNNIAREMPATGPKLFACCNPVPMLLRRDAKVVLELIQKATQASSATSRAQTTNVSTSTTSALPNAPAASSPCPSPAPCDGFAPPLSPTGETLPRPVDLTSQSPVLNTEQLYQVAGWVEPSGIDTSLPPSVSQVNAKVNSTPPLSTANLRSHLSTEEERGGYVPKCAVSPAAESGSALYSALSSQVSTPQTSIDFSKMFSGLTDGNPAARVSSLFFSNSPSPPPAVPACRLFPESPAGASPMDKSTAATPEQPEQKPKGKDSTPPEERVPRSLNEIYNLSKQNRKRNKDKKKLKEDNVPDHSPAFAVTATDDDDEVDTEDCPARPIQDPMEFMKGIGWVSDPEAVNQLLETTFHHEAGTSSGSSGKADSSGMAPPSAPSVPSASTHVPKPQRPAAPNRPQPPPARFPKKPFQHTSGSGFVPYDYSQAPAPFSSRK